MIITYILVIVIILLIIFLIKNKNKEFFNSNYNLKFVHIPKTAGTSIENAALKHNIKWGFRDWTKKDENENLIKDPNNCFNLNKPWINISTNYTSNKNNMCYPWHIPPSMLNRKVYKENDKLFCVVRNPYDRIVSEYKKHQSKNISKDELNKFIKNNINNTNIYNNDFKCHLIPQYKYTHGNIKCDHILKFENLDNEFKELMDKYNLSHIKLDKHENKSSNKLNKYDLTKESKEIIYNIYKKDFELLKYYK